MSIASEIARLQQAKADLKTAINSKGGNITTERIDQFASEVASLPSPKEEEEKILTPDFSSGNHVIVPTTDRVLRQVTLTKPAQLIPENIKKDVDICGVVGTAETSGGGLTGGYNVVYRSEYFSGLPSWISITLTFVDDTTASYLIKTWDGDVPSDWEHYVGNENMGFMTGPYVWSNVKSVSIGAHAYEGTPYLEINGVNVGATYNETLDSNILVRQGGGMFPGQGQ